MPQLRRYSKPRRGVILLIVVTLLTIFAVVGLAFVLYADAHSSSSKYFREAQDLRYSDGPNPVEIFNRSLGDLIYDVPDDTGIYNVARGNSMARSVWGWNYSYQGQASSVYYGSTQGANNTVAYNGYGMIPDPSYFRLNYTFDPSENVVYDPERVGTPRPAPNSPGSPGVPGTYVGKNLGYTYPDALNPYLAVMNPDGQVILPSFHRPDLGPVGVADFSNPNWNNPAMRKYIMRPMPIDHAGFPAIGRGGDVKNLLGAGNPLDMDSIWMDFDMPVRTWRGKLYKPLVAFLILDLDSRVNVNVAGNLLGTPPAMGQPGQHTSNQGWGPWEMNLAWALQNNPGAAVSEAQKILGGDATLTPQPVVGRNGRDLAAQYFNGTPLAMPGDMPRFYGQVDFDGSVVTNTDAQLRMLLPTSNYIGFPLFPGRFQNGSNAERTAHPLVYNPSLVRDMAPAVGNGDRSFSLAELLYLNRDPNDSTALASDLAKLAPMNLGVTPLPSGSINPRFAVTPISFDLDRPALDFMVPDATLTSYGLMAHPMNGAPNAPYPTSMMSYTPTSITPAAPSGNPTDFDTQNLSPQGFSSWRNLRAAIGSVDLNRKLYDYRFDATVPYSTTNINAMSFNTAVSERQQFAKDIYDRLVIATGANPAAAVGTAPSFTPEYNALRWLAQLAVNIVDYVDPDDCITPFAWNGTEFVYGTELPRLVLNEAFIQVNNDPMDVFKDDGSGSNLIADKPYHVNTWVELHNPFTVDPALPINAELSDGGAARLYDQTSGAPIYKVIVATIPPILPIPPGPPNQNYLRSIGNTNGTVAMGDIKTEITAYTPAAGFTPALPANQLPLVNPSNGGYNTADQTNNGFYLLGPAEDKAHNAIPNSTLRITGNSPAMGPSTGLKYELVNTTDPTMLAQHTIVLQRLACPYMPPGGNNPYITVDIMEGVQTQDAVEKDDKGDHAAKVPEAMRTSYGRRQPYVGYQVVAQAPTTPNAMQGRHTFFRHNSVSSTPAGAGDATLDQPFNWLTHLDRQLINPTELLQVSAFPPHLLTQQFMLGGMPYQHTAQSAFLDQTTRLYRSLELLRTRSRMAGVGNGGRIPGKINVNTAWGQNSWNAVFDAPPAGSPVNSVNLFTQNEVDTAWGAFSGSRNPGIVPSTSTDAPFTGFGSPVKGIGLTDGISGTMLRQPGGAPLFRTTPSTHPYEQWEMLTKGMNSMTTRSNCFAVWCTIGYFEVKDYNAGGRPRMGAELTDATGVTVRHKFFAVIDRSNIGIDPSDAFGATSTQRLPGPSPFFFALDAAGGTGPGAASITVPVSSFDTSIGTLNVLYENRAVPVTVGTPLVVDYGRNPNIPLNVDTSMDLSSRMEVVTVTSVSPAGVISFNLFKAHAPGTLISNVMMGNPGPQQNFNYASAPYDAVVPFVSRLR